MTFPHGRYLPGLLCLLSLFAVSCGAESGSDSLPDTPDTVTEISTELATRTTTVTTITTTAAVTTSASAQTTSDSSASSAETTASASSSATSASATASSSAATTNEASAASSATTSDGSYTLPTMTWWTPLPTSETTTILTTTSTTAVQTSKSVTSAATVSTPIVSTTAAKPLESNGNYTLSASDQKFLEGCVFVGDSICSGLKVYKVLPASRVVAKGSVGVRNIFTFKFTVGKYETDVISALKSLNPKRVIFSMGMNDINMTTAKQYCTNYQTLLTKTQEALPNAQLYAASITPISAGISFSTNSKIDKYNAALQSHLSNYPGWTYVDVSKELKTSANALDKKFNGGDGIHLSPAAYQAYLWQVCKQLNK